ncbi:MAG: DUF4870 domain-containing protein [Vulcanimicrobiaceae bacterium]
MLAAKIDAKRRPTMVGGGVGPSQGTWSDPGAYQHQHQQQSWGPPPPAPPRVTPVSTVATTVRPETRAFVALSYPFWPLALLALLDAKGSHFVRRQAWQALGFNFGMYGLGAMLTAISTLPFIGWSAWPLLSFIFPVTVVASVVYAFRVWQGDDVSVPIVSDWVDARLPA